MSGARDAPPFASHSRGAPMKPIAVNSFAGLFALALAAVATAPASAQLPFGPRADMGKPPVCTKDYKQTLDLQVAALEKFRTAAPQAVGQVCSLIESGSAWLDHELSDGTRQRIKGLLGVDIDLRFIQAQCRVSQGNLDRELMTELGFLKSEQVRCKDSAI